MDYPLSSNENTTYSSNPHLVGVELEVEFGDDIYEPASVTGWRKVSEGSLRNGVEYITKFPTTLPEIKTRAALLYKSLDEAPVINSIRCSTHVHVNVGHLEKEELYSAILLYYLIEESFLSTQPPKRRGNLFCLRLQDVRSLEQKLKEIFRGGADLVDLASEYTSYKYGAMNLAAIGKLGTLEFRFFDEAKTKEEMDDFTKAMWHLVNSCRGKTPKDILEEYDSEITSEDFTKKYNLLYKYIPETFDYRAGAWTNYSFVSDAVKILYPEKKGYIKSLAGINPDIGEEE